MADPAPEQVGLLRTTYERFNARDIDGVLAALSPDVAWANGMEGGFVHGHEGVRDYLTRQWATIDPHVEPRRFAFEPGGCVAVDVHQVVRDLDGSLRAERDVVHVYTFRAGLVERFEIRGQ